MYKRALLVISYLFFFISSSIAQKNIVHVNEVTGTANVMIPLYTLSAAHISLPINVNYNARGIGTNDVEGTAGMGWNFNAGGAITRQVRGLPDDVTKDMAGNDSYGWIYGHTGSAITSLPITNDNNTATYQDVATDMATINSYFGFSDTEPDIFYVSAPGLTCQLVYDDLNATFRTIPYQDVKIAYKTSTVNGPTFGEITSFTITNDEGIIYTFSALETSTQKAFSPMSNLQYFKTRYNQYQNGISYTSAWNLTQIQDPYNNTVNLTYNPGFAKGFTNPSALAFPVDPSNPPPNSAPILNRDTILYKLTGGTTPQLLSNISYSDGVNTDAFTLEWSRTNYTNKYCITSIKGFGHNFTFTYSPEVGPDNTYQRSFLRSVADGDCSSPFNYSFAYSGETYNSNNLFPYTTALLDSVQSRSVTDNWGYLTGNLTAGTLTKVNYSDGGYTNLSYEPNDYYDPVSGVVKGGGIRIKQISHSDGNTANDIVTNYSYSDPVSGVTSGKPISLPVLSFIRPYRGQGNPVRYWTGTEWIEKGSQADLLRYSTISSSSDLSEEDHTILYQYVSEGQPGAGSTLYQFAIPGTNWDNITSPLPWSPTTINTGSATTASTGFLKNSVNIYPFPPNPNYDFERGLVVKQIDYDNNKNEVRESSYTYQNSGTPINIAALKYDINAYGVSYSKYNIYTTTGPLLSQITNKVFDSSSTSSFLQTTSNYTYNTTQNKLIRQALTNSDGSVRTVNFLYAKDYNTANAIDGPAQAIKALQQLNINSPIEQYIQITAAGSSQPKTISADLAKFSNGWPAPANGLVLPIAKMKFVAPDGVTDFSPSSTNTGNYNYDSRYFTAENDLGYDFSGNLLSKDDGFKNVQTSITDHNFYKTVATFSNARFDEVAISDFDSRLVNLGFNLSGGTVTSNSRTGQYGWSLSAGQTLSKTINRNLIAQNYVFSIWINSGTTGQFTVSVTGGTVTNTRTISYNSTTGNPTGWQYYEVKIPLINISSPTINISAVGNQNVIIDDVLAYPDVSGAKTYAYDQITRTMTAETNTNGVSVYYSYDQLGRLHYTYDQDKNILIRKQYALGNNVQNISTAFGISAPSTASSNLPVTFNVINTFIPCVVANVTYTWNFGDGSPTVTGINADHTFTTNGTYTVSLTANSPVYGVVTKTAIITVSSLAQTNVTYTNFTEPGDAADKTLVRIVSVTFMQGTTTVYTLTEAQLKQGINIVPGAYTMIVKASGPAYSASTGFGYSAVVYAGSSPTVKCQNRNINNSYTFTDDFSNTPNIVFSIQNAVCQ